MKKLNFILAGLFLLTSNYTNAQVLNVPEVIQEEDQWCWAGCTKSILNYYKFPVQQCDIAEYARTVITWHNFGSSHCCDTADFGCNYWNYAWSYKGSMQDILLHFDSIQNYGVSYAIDLNKINTEIAGERPFIIRWGWNTGGGHFIVGHGISDSTVYYMNPWFGEGLHIANYEWLQYNGQHTWTHTNVLTTSPPPVVNIKTIRKENIVIYPNPGNGVFTVSSDISFSETAVIEITDILGKDILHMNLTGSVTEINLTAQPQGIYVVKINDNGKIRIEKLMKL